MSTAIYPGTFDPPTFGHLDIARRAAHIFSKVIAVVADNPKKNTTFSIEERLDMVGESIGSIDNVEVVQHSGLIVECLKKYKATTIIRGLRALSDFEYEFQMAFTNRKMYERAETVFLMPDSKYIYLSSSLVKQIARHDGDISSFVPSSIIEKIKGRIK